MAKSSRILILGANGQLGRELVRQLGDLALALSRHQCDLAEPASLAERLREFGPATIINAAGYTRVDDAEQDSQLCHRVNAESVGRLAEVANLWQTKLVHISTDYVFGGDASRSSPYAETDQPSPQSEYAHSKRDGERFAATADDHLIVRTCGLYSAELTVPPLKNFANTMFRLASDRDEIRVVDDQWCQPSYVPHVAAAIVSLLQHDSRGLVHVVNEGATTWCRFAAHLLAAASLGTKVTPIPTSDYPLPARRPNYSLLATDRVAVEIGRRLPTWEQGIADYLTARGLAASQ